MIYTIYRKSKEVGIEAYWHYVTHTKAQEELFNLALIGERLGASIDYVSLDKIIVKFSDTVIYFVIYGSIENV